RADDGSSFTIRPDYSHNEIYDVYAGLQGRSQPQFITTDVVLHTGHLLFDYSLRAIEIDRLYGLAEKLTGAMVKSTSRGLFSDIPYPGVDDDLKSVLAYFCVAAKCLDPAFEVPQEVRERVEADLERMEKHEGFSIAAVIDQAEDFSQYVPRGHYTRNEQFKRYFKAMMWYGRRMFRVEEVRGDCLPIPERWSEEHRTREARQMLIITRMLHTAVIEGKPAIETWNKLYVPTVLFAGRTEDLNPAEVKGLAEKVWGKLPDLSDLGNTDKLNEFIRLAAAFSKPKVDSSGAGRKGFCFMAQRFTPDSYITQCLVTDADRPFGEGVPAHPLIYSPKRKPRPFTWGSNPILRPPERRFMPRGLDVMAVFGCDEALAILRADGDTKYEGYDEMLAFLRKDVGKMMAERKEENLYYAWLHALQPMMTSIDSKKVPDCLRSQGWLRKQLATSLGSWAELRHDTILYVKQSYTPAPRGAPPRPRIPHGYVEPQPEVFRRIGKMVAKMRTDLAALGVMPDGLEGSYGRFAEICESLAAIAEKELAGKDLSQEDDRFIAYVSRSLKGTTLLPQELRKKILSETDSKMALIADVHTDNNAKVVLEEGVGTPFLLAVEMPLAGAMTTLHGAVFSYYEFKHPMKDRLTDEAWQKMLADAAKRPETPTWYPASK
ncbi:MAG TPA: DUF3160 domain-containing protein, partial [Phycisphaerae bacterium]|nr:DUF3160 domain-containing protein [Phycisphaerae bacterium]